jgi:methylase of polypeptide subunit release factors
MPRQGRVFEWCAGPGFIGFALLGYGFCDTLCLADVNPEAVEACRRTVAQNRLAERVAVYHSDNLDGIPASEQWDLVVGNPPRFVDISPGELRFHDEDWKLHRRFFSTIGSFLKPGGNHRAFGKQSWLHGGDMPRHDRGGGIVHLVRAQLRRSAHAVYAHILCWNRAARRCCSRLGAAAGA